MLTWIGFIAKITEFFVEKIGGRKIDISLSERHRAAKALVSFYHTLDESGVLVATLLRVFDVALERKKPVIFSKDLVPFENDVIRLNNELSKQFAHLAGAISILYPELANLLCQVSGFKRSIITAFGRLLQKARFEIEFDGLHPFKKVTFSTFRDDVAKIDLEEIVRTPVMFPDDFAPSGPEHNRLVEALSTLLIEDQFTASDFEKLEYLRDRLRNQKSLLDNAVGSLRAFIAENFTFSDLLYAGADRLSRGIVWSELR